MRIKWFSCKDHVSWKPVFISKYVGVSGLSFATKTTSGKAVFFFFDGRIGRILSYMNRAARFLLLCRFPLEPIRTVGSVGSGSSRSHDIEGASAHQTSMDRSTIQPSLLGSTSICHLGNTWWWISTTQDTSESNYSLTFWPISISETPGTLAHQKASGPS